MSGWLWTEAPVALLGGLLGSSHRLGMCGPFALMIGGGASSWPANLARQSLFTMGRVFTYAVMGAAAGFGGMRLAEWLGSGLRVAPIVLSVVAGVLLLRQGLLSLGWARPWQGAGPCLGGSLLSGLLRDRRLGSVFLAGLFTGFLPCGLVYGFLALAGASSHWLPGMVVMTAFGIGTAPAMIAAGAASGALRGALRGKVLKFAAWSVVVAGSAAIVRGAVFAGALLQGGSQPQDCPFCHPAERVAAPSTILPRLATIELSEDPQQ